MLPSCDEGGISDILLLDKTPMICEDAFMNITNPLHIDMIERFRQFANRFDSDPNCLTYPDPLHLPESNYILDYDIMINRPINDFHSLIALQLHLNDELPSITLIAIYDDDDDILHLTLEADLQFSDIPTHSIN